MKSPIDMRQRSSLPIKDAPGRITGLSTSPRSTVRPIAGVFSLRWREVALFGGILIAAGMLLAGSIAQAIAQTTTVTPMVAGGDSHSLILKSDGTVWACGKNDHGQLGNSYTTGRSIPSQVLGGTQGSEHLSGIISVAAGDAHSLALTEDGHVLAWGDNADGQLGNGVTTDSWTPVQVKGPNGVGALSGIKEVAAGGSHSLALTSDGRVYAWGNNNNGQLGINSTTDRSTPVQIGGFAVPVKHISAGWRHSLAVDTGDIAWAWGDNDYGQLGTNDAPTDHHVAVKVWGGPYLSVDGYLGGVANVAAGDYHSLALMNGGSARGWGSGGAGQIGDGTTLRHYTPVNVNMTGINALVAGGAHSLALRNGAVYAWGANADGQLGNGTITSSSNPAPIQGLTGITTLSGGGSHSLAVKNDGTVWAWGLGDNGRLGNDSTVDQSAPVQVWLDAQDRFLSGVTKVAAGCTGYHSLALKDDGYVYAWGWNSSGQLGNGIISDADPAPVHGTPVQVVGGMQGVPYLSGIIDVSAGGSHSLAAANDGIVYAWGFNGNGQLGIGSTGDRSYPLKVHGPEDQGFLGDGISTPPMVAVAAGRGHSLALTNDGHVYAWGSNTYGKLGVNSDNPHLTPVQVHGVGNAQPPEGLSGIVAVAAGYHHSLALGADGHVYAWGSNEHGQLGVHSDNNHPYPVQVHGVDNVGYLSDIVAVAAGYQHSLAVDKDGHVYSWGEGGYGQLGLNSNNDHSVPYQVHGLDNGQPPENGLSGIVDVAAGQHFSLALGADGTVYSWGENYHGQLGTNSNNDHLYPVKVYIGGGLPRAVDVAAGEVHAVALGDDSTVWDWGDFNDSPGPVIADASPQAERGPKVTRMVPAHRATGVPRRTNVTATFSVTMNKGTLTGKNFKLFELSDKGRIQISVSVTANSKGTKVTLNPYGSSTKALRKTTDYEVVITSGARDRAGNAMTKHSWRFTTGTRM